MEIHSTTILALAHRVRSFSPETGRSLSANSIEHGACKIRKLQDGQVLAGFAVASIHSLSLSASGASLRDIMLGRAAVELARGWRATNISGSLTMMVVSNSERFITVGVGDVIQPDDGVLAIGSGGSMRSAARPDAPQRS
jgi:ATP-dependent HslUV protease subunit HslV